MNHHQQERRDAHRKQTDPSRAGQAVDAPALHAHRRDNDTASQGNAAHRAVAVDIAKYRKQGLYSAGAAFAAATLSTILLDRSSSWSSWWILAVVLVIVGVHSEYARHIQHQYEADTQRAKGSVVGQGAASDGSQPFETADWINGVIEKLVPIVNTDLLLPVLDVLEDAMKAEFPKLISAVRIEGLDLGQNPFKIVKVKRLDPDQPIAEGHDPESDSSRHVNLEIHFAYQGEERASATQNIHMLVYVAVGLEGVQTVEIPIFAELSSASGVMRTRVELISDPPFVRQTTVSFPTMPEFTLSARPLKTLNVMRLPMLSDYVHAAVADVLGAFIAPNAFTLDAARLIMGQDVDLNTESQGVAVVVIHSASGLSDTDHGSKSDPFVLLTWSKLGKIMHVTRVVRNELNPRWEEVAFVPVPPDAIREGERLSLELWDSDKITADDSLGKVEVSIQTLFEAKGELLHFDMPLEKAIRSSNNKGNVRFSAGYFHVHDLSKGGSKGISPGTTIKMKVGGTGAPLVDQEGSEKRSGHYADRIKETMDAKMPPSPKQNSGILAIQVHQLADLALPAKQRALKHGAKTDTHTPSTYAQVFINDALVFKTRLKRLSSSPYINAKTEAFCRDWTRTRVDIVILDSREREDDAVIGIVSMRLADMFASTSQVSAWRPLLGGIGSGRIRVSILFKPVDVYLPPSLRGWDVGTVLIERITARGVAPGFQGAVSVCIAGAKYRVRTDDSNSEDGNETVTWTCDPPLRVPLLNRYQRALSVRLLDTHSSLGRTKNVGEGIVWPSHLVDDSGTIVRVDLYSAHKEKRRRENRDLDLLALPTNEARREDPKDAPDQEARRDGLRFGKPEGPNDALPHLEISIRFSRGLSSLHSALAGETADPSLYAALKMRDYAIEAGERRQGSARFMHRDGEQRAVRQRQIRNAKKASLTQDQLAREDHTSAIPRDGVVNLGYLEQEEGGGLGEGALDDVDSPGVHSASGTQDEVYDEREWEEDAADRAEDAERYAQDDPRLAKRKQDFRSDRMHQRGVFQSKAGRTTKWLKDASTRKLRGVQRKLRHSDQAPDIAEEGISSL